jgi:hypothetical protein
MYAVSASVKALPLTRGGYDANASVRDEMSSWDMAGTSGVRDRDARPDLLDALLAQAHSLSSKYATSTSRTGVGSSKPCRQSQTTLRITPDPTTQFGGSTPRTTRRRSMNHRVSPRILRKRATSISSG